MKRQLMLTFTAALCSLLASAQTQQFVLAEGLLPLDKPVDEDFFAITPEGKLLISDSRRILITNLNGLADGDTIGLEAEANFLLTDDLHIGNMGPIGGGQGYAFVMNRGQNGWIKRLFTFDMNGRVSEAALPSLAPLGFIRQILLADDGTLFMNVWQSNAPEDDETRYVEQIDFGVGNEGMQRIIRGDRVFEKLLEAKTVHSFKKKVWIVQRKYDPTYFMANELEQQLTALPLGTDEKSSYSNLPVQFSVGGSRFYNDWVHGVEIRDAWEKEEFQRLQNVLDSFDTLVGAYAVGQSFLVALHEPDPKTEDGFRLIVEKIDANGISRGRTLESPGHVAIGCYLDGFYSYDPVNQIVHRTNL
jgi:hypothetical protein